MPPSTTVIQQNEIPVAPGSAEVHRYSLEKVGKIEADFLQAASSEDPPCVVGVSLELADSGPRIRTLALATPNHVFNLSLHRPPSQAQKRILRRLFSKVPHLTGFEFPYTIVLLAHALGCDISGHDLSTIDAGSMDPDSYMQTPGTLIAGQVPLASRDRINRRWENGLSCSDTKSKDDALKLKSAVQAWFTAIAASIILPELQVARLLSTKYLGRAMLRHLVDFCSRSIHLELMKPLIQEIDFSDVLLTPEGLMIENTRFKTRVRASKHEPTRVEIHLKNGDVITARPKRAQGRFTLVVTTQGLTDSVSHIRVVGREDRTCAEKARYQFLESSLTRSHRRDIPFFAKAIWFPKYLKGHSGRQDAKTGPSFGNASQLLKKLNDSQREVATAMLSVSKRDSLVIVHGPPGTGKTTTIAAAAATWVDRKVPCWMIAQSNVGVKNIAETLFKRGVKFKLLVSKEFIVGWHEGLYEEVKDAVIRSDVLRKREEAGTGVQDIFDGITLVLSTLSMLSDPILNTCGLLSLIPVTSLVVDEASQIDVFEFMHLFHKFSKVLRKLCLFGDPKQLPPYGASEADLQTIFDVSHLKKTSYLLNTQYRLPVPLGGFISEAVYEGKLHSSHNIVDRSCVVFIDVGKGKEARKGKSYQNTEEVHMAVRVAKRYHERHLSFCVITFYDHQRAAITKALKAEDLPSECVYNVDSFQGNEADYVILSSVRTRKPGFLNSLARTNVALTRCRKGMVVVTNKGFLQGPGKSTLLGKLCDFWALNCKAWIDWKTMLGKDVGLPGIPNTA